MKEFRVIEIKKSVTEDNDRDAERLRQELKQEGTLLVNLMSSPGSGKTTTLLGVLRALKDDLRVAVMEADIDSDVDAKTIADVGVDVVQLHTGGMCHLDAGMTRDGLSGLDAEKRDLVIIENVGNLVCPAEFDTGAARNMMILSVPEGDDKPLKYPLMFSSVDLLVVNKIDVSEHFDFDMDKLTERVRAINPDIKIISISAKTGVGIETLADWLKEEVACWKGSM